MTRSIVNAIATLVLALRSASAQPALVLDPAFHPEVTAPGGAVERVVLQPDGRLIVFGRFDALNGGGRGNLVRLNSDGSVDESYRPGLQVQDPGVTLVQPDGRLVMAGHYRTPAGTEAGLLRLNPDGTLDAIFLTRADLGTDQLGAIERLAIQPDGRLLLGGWFNRIGGQPRRGLARLNPDGSLDPTFDAGRGLEGPNSGAEADHLSAPRTMALQADGKILVGGAFTRAGGVSRTGIARFNPDGSVDPAFAPRVAGDLFAIVVQSGGKIVMAGRFGTVNGERRPYVARLNPDGTLDSGFSMGPGFSPPDGAVSADRMPGGDSLLVWNPFADGPIFRLDSEGRRDTGWTPVRGYLLGMTEGGVVIEDAGRSQVSWHGESGRLEHVLGLQPETAQTVPVTVQPDGGMLMLPLLEGTRVNGVLRTGQLLRLNADGGLDPSLSLVLASTRRADRVGQLAAYALMPDGKIAIGGDFTSVNGRRRDRLARLNTDASLDETFGPDDVGAIPTALLAQRSGHLVVGTDHGLVRLTPAGPLDSSFIPPSGSSLYGSRPYRLVTAPGPDDTFLVYHPRDGLVRLEADGARDESSAPIPTPWIELFPVVLMPERKYLRRDFEAGPPDYLLPARFNADGSRDRSFRFEAASHLPDPFVMSLVALPDGKLLAGIGSWSAESQHYDSVIVRLLPDGREDSTFPPVAFTLQAHPPSPWGTIHLDMTLQPYTDGGVVLTGVFSGVNGHRRFGLARFHPVPAVRAGRGAPAGGFEATIGGRPDWTYRVEGSTDLVEWRLVRQLPSTGAQTPFKDTEAAADTKRFYRVSLTSR